MWENPSDEELRNLLRGCRHIAIVGLSAQPERDSYRVTEYMQQRGYLITRINPGLAEILGRPCHPSLKAVPNDVPIDMVNIFRRSSMVSPHVDEAIERKVRSIWMQFDVIDEAAARRATVAGITVVMNRCLMVEHRMLIGR